MACPRAGRFDPSRYGFAHEQVAEVVATLCSVSFRDVATQHREMGWQPITAVPARRN